MPSTKAVSGETKVTLAASVPAGTGPPAGAGPPAEPLPLGALELWLVGIGAPLVDLVVETTAWLVLAWLELPHPTSTRKPASTAATR